MKLPFTRSYKGVTVHLTQLADRTEGMLEIRIRFAEDGVWVELSGAIWHQELLGAVQPSARCKETKVAHLILEGCAEKRGDEELLKEVRLCHLSPEMAQATYQALRAP